MSDIYTTLDYGQSVLFPQVSSNVFYPSNVDDETKIILAEAMKASPVPSSEKHLLKMHYEGNKRLLDNIFVKPASWKDEAWQVAKRLQILVNSTKASIRMLVGNLYGGTQRRALNGTADGKAEIQAYIKSPSFGAAMRKRARNAYLFGTASQVPLFENGEFCVHTLDPSRTSYVRNLYTDEVDAVVEYNAAMWYSARVFMRRGYGRLAKMERYSKWAIFSNPLLIDPWVISTGYPDCGDRYTGISMVRECPEIDANLSQLWWALSLVARMKGSSVIALFMEDKNAQVDAHSMGFNTMLMMGQDDKIGQITNSSNLNEMVAAMESMMGTESAILGTPTSKDARSHQSATGAEIQNSSLASQITLLVKDAIDAEVETIVRLIQSYRVMNNLSNLTHTQIIEAYQPDVLITSSIDEQPLKTKFETATAGVAAGVDQETAKTMAGVYDK